MSKIPKITSYIVRAILFLKITVLILFQNWAVILHDQNKGSFIDTLLSTEVALFTHRFTHCYVLKVAFIYTLLSTEDSFIYTLLSSEDGFYLYIAIYWR